ncbi:MAG TPA: phospho-sugar mutase [Trebonia sp.]|nr:phospho-sugar mutase [Trebonia sp.]
MDSGLRATVEAWIADDPDDRDRAELTALLECGDRGAAAELRERFAGRLTFGTAGLRGAVGAGPARMNRAVVRGVTAAVAGWLRAQAPGPGQARAGELSVVVGCDARHRSAEFADEVARVLAGAGIRAHVLPRPCPTPLLAFAVRHLGTRAGIMITASHNPAADNGYKLYLADGAQVIPPADAEIEARSADPRPLAAIPVAPLDDPLVTWHGDEVAAAYLDQVAGPPAGADAGAGARLEVVYTAMHGVAGALMLRAIERAGFAAPHVVKAQAEPDPDFPTVAFPNPEEPGALDLAFADARAREADLVLASDPDGDRLAVAVPAADGTWRQLTGDQLGALLGAYLLRTHHDGTPLVATTIVSATLLRKVAAAHGARYKQTLTGFKWIARAGDEQPDATFVFGYEEALGYLVGQVVRDKDGIGAALAVLRMATGAKAGGRTLLDEYAALEAAYGAHRTRPISLRIPDPPAVMRSLRARPPAAIAGHQVRATTDYLEQEATGLPASDVLSYALDGARVVIRPSGTEPKIKAYLEAETEDVLRELTDATRALLDHA